MKHKIKAAMTSTVLALAVVTLAGCVASSKASDPAKETAASAAPTASEQAPADLGDVIVKTDEAGQPVVVTDAAGSYQKVTIDPAADVLKLDPATFDATVTSAGWSDEDILSAQQWLVTFVVEQGIDSIAADGPTGWDEWKATQASTFIAPEYASINDLVSEGSDRNSFIENNPSQGMPLMIRDGSPRVGATAVALTRVRSFDYDGTISLEFKGTATVAYRVTDESRLATLRSLNPGVADEEIVAQKPHVADGVDEDLTLDFDFEYAVRKDPAAGWLIIGFQNGFRDDGV